MRSGLGPGADSGRIRGLSAIVVWSLAVCALVAPTVADAAGSAPYRSQGWPLAGDLVRAELPWTNEARLGFPARPPRDARGVPMVPCPGRGPVYPTGMLSINGMKRLDAYLDSGDERQLEQARRQAQRLRLMARRSAGAWWLPHACDYAPEDQHAPWWNAMTQGLAVSFFVRLHHVTRDARDLEAARRIARSFAVLGPRHGPWVSYVGSDGSLWLEHYPRRRPSHVLNAHLHALIGLYELWDETREPWVRRLLEGAITTMRRHLPRYRRPGALSRYDLRNRTAHVKYHAIHVWQLRFLARISGDPWFWRMADRFARDARPKPKAPGKPRVARRPDPSLPCPTEVSLSQPLPDSGAPVLRTPPSALGAPVGCG